MPQSLTNRLFGFALSDVGPARLLERQVIQKISVRSLARTSRSLRSSLQQIRQSPPAPISQRRLNNTALTTHLRSPHSRPVMSSASLFSPGYILLIGLSIPVIYLSATTARLLASYPTTDIDPSHPVYAVPGDTRFKQADCHWFSAKIPSRLLQSPPNLHEKNTKNENRRHLSPVERWTSAFFSTPTLALEASLIGLWIGRGFHPADQGTLGIEKGQALAHGTFMVESVDQSNNRIIVSYKIPDAIVSFGERLASWGLPYRHISGGRHCLEVVNDQKKSEESASSEDFVTVKFGCAIDLEKVNRITGEEDGKLMPVPYIWFHEIYARWLLDGAIKKLQRLHE